MLSMRSLRPRKPIFMLPSSTLANLHARAFEDQGFPVDYVIYLYPGNVISVSAPSQLVIRALAPGEVPPAGSTVIPTPPPPQTVIPIPPPVAADQPVVPLVVMTAPK